MLKKYNRKRLCAFILSFAMMINCFPVYGSEISVSDVSTSDSSTSGDSSGSGADTSGSTDSSTDTSGSADSSTDTSGSADSSTDTSDSADSSTDTSDSADSSTDTSGSADSSTDTSGSTDSSTDTSGSTDISGDTNTPSDDTNTPSDDTNTPSDDTNTPSDDTNTPSDEVTPPSDDTNTPSDDTNTPSDEVTPPSDDTNTPSDEVTPPSDEVVPPSDEVVPPTDEVVPPSDEVVPPSDEVVPPSDEVVPPSDEVVPPTDEVVPPTDEVVPPSDEVVPPTDEVVPPVKPEEILPPQNVNLLEEVPAEPTLVIKAGDVTYNPEDSSTRPVIYHTIKEGDTSKSDTVTLKAVVTDMPEGGKIDWSASSSAIEMKPAEDNTTATVKALMANTTASVTVKVLDKDGATVLSQKVYLVLKLGIERATSVVFTKEDGTVIDPLEVQKLYYDGPHADTKATFKFKVKAMAGENEASYQNFAIGVSGTIEDVLVEKTGEDEYTASIKPDYTPNKTSQIVFYALDENTDATTSAVSSIIKFKVVSGNIKPTSVKIEQQDAKIYVTPKAGTDASKTVALKLLVTPDDYSVPATTVWSIPDDEQTIATVDSDGVVTAVSPGTVQVSAQFTVKKEDLIAAGFTTTIADFVKTVKTTVTVAGDSSKAESILIQEVVKEGDTPDKDEIGKTIANGGKRTLYTKEIAADPDAGVTGQKKKEIWKVTPYPEGIADTSDLTATIISGSSLKSVNANPATGKITVEAHDTIGGTSVVSIKTGAVEATVRVNVIAEGNPANLVTIKKVSDSSVMDGTTMKVDYATINPTTGDAEKIADIVIADTFTAEATDAEGAAISGLTFTWEATPASIIQVDGNTKLKFMGGAGKATITATANDGSGKSAKFYITVNPFAATTFDVKTDPGSGNESALGKIYEIYTDIGGASVKESLDFTVELPAVTTSTLTSVISSTSYVVIKDLDLEAGTFSVATKEGYTGTKTATITVTVGTVVKTFKVTTTKYTTSLNNLIIKKADGTEPASTETLYVKKSGDAFVPNDEANKPGELTVEVFAVPNTASGELSTLAWSSSDPLSVKAEPVAGTNKVKLTALKETSSPVTIAAKVGAVIKSFKVKVVDADIAPIAVTVQQKQGDIYSAVSSIKAIQKDDASYDAITLKAVPTPENAKFTVLWTSNNDRLIAVADGDKANQEITLQPISGQTGRVVITATITSSNGTELTHNVTVDCRPETIATPVKAIVVTDDQGEKVSTTSVDFNTSKEYTVKLYSDTGATTEIADAEYEVFSSDTSVVTVENVSSTHALKITGVNKGYATVTVAATDGSGRTKSITVTVNPSLATSLTVKQDISGTATAFDENAIIEVFTTSPGDELTFTAEANAGSTADITVNSSKSDVVVTDAAVSPAKPFSTFKVNAKTATKALITVKADDQTFTFYVQGVEQSSEITNAAIAKAGESFILTESNLYVKDGGAPGVSGKSNKIQLEVLPRPAGLSFGNDAEFKWTAKDPTVIEFDDATSKTPTLTALRSGADGTSITTVVTATVTDGDKTYTANIKITVEDVRIHATSMSLLHLTKDDEGNDITPSVNGKTIKAAASIKLKAVPAPEGVPVTYKWTVNGVNGLIAAITDTTAEVTLAPNMSVPGAAVVTVTATDEYNNTVTSSVTIDNMSEDDVKATSLSITDSTSTTVSGSYNTIFGAADSVFTAVLGGSPTVQTVTATSSDETIATVTVSGLTVTVKPLAVGSATITVKTVDGSNLKKSFIFNVAGIPATGLQVKTDANKEADGNTYTIYNKVPSGVSSATTSYTFKATMDNASATTDEIKVITSSSAIKVVPQAPASDKSVTFVVSCADDYEQNTTSKQSVRITAGGFTKTVYFNVENYSDVLTDFAVTVDGVTESNATLYVRPTVADPDVYEPADAKGEIILIATPMPENAELEDITWTVDSGADNITYTIDATNHNDKITIKGAKPGTAVVRASATIGGIKKEHTFSIKVKDDNINVKTIDILKDGLSVTSTISVPSPFADVNLTSLISPSDAKLDTVVWTVNAGAPVTLTNATNSGVTVHRTEGAYGSAIVTLTVTDESGTVLTDSVQLNYAQSGDNFEKVKRIELKDTVENTVVNSLSFVSGDAPKTLNIVLNQGLLPVPTVPDVTAVSSDTNVATASVSAGVLTVTATGIGNAQIKVLSNDGHGAQTILYVTVTPKEATGVTLAVSDFNATGIGATAGSITAVSELDATKLISWVDGDAPTALIHLEGTETNKLATDAKATFKLTAALAGSGISYDDVTWSSSSSYVKITPDSSSDAKVVTVEVSRFVENAVITVTSKDGAVSKTFTLTAVSSITAPETMTVSIDSVDVAEDAVAPMATIYSDKVTDESKVIAAAFTSTKALDPVPAGKKVVEDSVRIKIKSGAAYATLTTDNNGVTKLTPVNNAIGTVVVEVTSLEVPTLTRTLTFKIAKSTDPLTAISFTDESGKVVREAELNYKSSAANTIKVKVKTTPVEATNIDAYDLTVVSSNDSVVKVSGPVDGVYTLEALKGGIVTITATYADVNDPAVLDPISVEMPIISKDPNAIPAKQVDVKIQGASTMIDTSTTIVDTKTIAFEASAIDKNKDPMPNLAYNWILSGSMKDKFVITTSGVNNEKAVVKFADNAVIAVDDTVKITVEAGDGSGVVKTFDLNVIANPVVVITPDEAEMVVDVEADFTGGQTFHYTVTPANATNGAEAVTWVSADPSIAVVGDTTLDSGRKDAATVQIRGVARGTTTITGTAGDATTTIKVISTTTDGIIPTELKITQDGVDVTGTTVLLDSALTPADKINLLAVGEERADGKKVDNTVTWEVEGDLPDGISAITDLFTGLPVGNVTTAAELTAVSKAVGTIKLKATSVANQSLSAIVTVDVQYGEAYIHEVTLSKSADKTTKDTPITIKAAVDGVSPGANKPFNPQVEFKIYDGASTTPLDDTGLAAAFKETLTTPIQGTELTLTPKLGGKTYKVETVTYDDTTTTPGFTMVGKDISGDVIKRDITFTVDKKVPYGAKLFTDPTDTSTVLSAATEFYVNVPVTLTALYYDSKADYDSKTAITTADLPSYNLDNFKFSISNVAALKMEDTATPATDKKVFTGLLANGKSLITYGPAGTAGTMITVKSIAPKDITVTNVTDSANPAVVAEDDVLNLTVNKDSNGTITAEGIKIEAVLGANDDPKFASLPSGASNPTNKNVRWTVSGNGQYFINLVPTDAAGSDAPYAMIMPKYDERIFDIINTPADVVAEIKVTSILDSSATTTRNFKVKIVPKQPANITLTPTGADFTPDVDPTKLEGTLINRSSVEFTAVVDVDSPYQDVVFSLEDPTHTSYVDLAVDSTNKNKVKITAKKVSPKAPDTLDPVVLVATAGTVEVKYEITIVEKASTGVKFYDADGNDITATGIDFYPDMTNNDVVVYAVADGDEAPVWKDGTDASGTSTLENSNSKGVYETVPTAADPDVKEGKIKLTISNSTVGTWAAGKVDYYSAQLASDATTLTRLKVNIKNYKSYISTIDTSAIAPVTLLDGKGQFKYPITIVQGKDTTSVPTFAVRTAAGTVLADINDLGGDSLMDLVNLNGGSYTNQADMFDTFESKIETDADGNTWAVFNVALVSDAAEAVGASTPAFVIDYDEAGRTKYTKADTTTSFLNGSTDGLIVIGGYIEATPMYITVSKDTAAGTNIIVAGIDLTNPDDPDYNQSNAQALTINKPAHMPDESTLDVYTDIYSNVVWTSSDSNIVSIVKGSDAGVETIEVPGQTHLKLKGEGKGSAEITVTSKVNNDVTVKFTVNVGEYVESTYIKIDGITDASNTETIVKDFDTDGLTDTPNTNSTNKITLKAISYATKDDDATIIEDKIYDWQIVGGSATAVIEGDATKGTVTIQAQTLGDLDVVVSDGDVSKIIHVNFVQKTVLPTGIEFDDSGTTIYSSTLLMEDVATGTGAKTYELKFINSEGSTVTDKRFTATSKNTSIATVTQKSSIDGLTHTITITPVHTGETMIEVTSDSGNNLKVLLPVVVTSNTLVVSASIAADEETIYTDKTPKQAVLNLNGVLDSNATPGTINWGTVAWSVDQTDIADFAASSTTDTITLEAKKSGTVTVKATVTGADGPIDVTKVITVKSSIVVPETISAVGTLEVNCDGSDFDFAALVRVFGKEAGETIEKEIDKSLPALGTIKYENISPVADRIFTVGANGKITFTDPTTTAHTGSNLIRVTYTSAVATVGGSPVEISKDFELFTKCIHTVVTGITTDKTNYTVYYDGTNAVKPLSLDIPVKFTPAYDANLLKTVTAVSSDPSIVSVVGGDGKITVKGEAAGYATILIKSLTTPSATRQIMVVSKSAALEVQFLDVMYDGNASDLYAGDGTASPTDLVKFPQTMTVVAELIDMDGNPILYNTPNAPKLKWEITAGSGLVEFVDPGPADTYKKEVTLTDKITAMEGSFTVKASLADDPSVYSEYEGFILKSNIPATSIDFGSTTKPVSVAVVAGQEYKIIGDIVEKIEVGPSDASNTDYTVTIAPADLAAGKASLKVVDDEQIVEILKPGTITLIVEATGGTNVKEIITLIAGKPEADDTSTITWKSGGIDTNEGSTKFTMQLTGDPKYKTLKAQLMVKNAAGDVVSSTDPIMTLNTITWTSSNANYVTVEKDSSDPTIATLTAIKDTSGSPIPVFVEATIGSKTFRIRVEVKSGIVIATGITVTPTTGTLKFGPSATGFTEINATAALQAPDGLNASDITDKTITWTASVPNVVKITPTDATNTSVKITLVDNYAGPERTVIVNVSGVGEFSAKPITIQVQNSAVIPDKVVVNGGAPVSLEEGNTFDVASNIQFLAADNTVLTPVAVNYLSTRQDLFTISDAGVITAVKAGTGQLVITCAEKGAEEGKQFASVDITVTPKVIAGTLQLKNPSVAEVTVKASLGNGSTVNLNDLVEVGTGGTTGTALGGLVSWKVDASNLPTGGKTTDLRFKGTGVVYAGTTRVKPNDYIVIGTYNGNSVSITVHVVK